MIFYREKEKEFRKQKKIKIKEMAKFLGVSPHTISSWEKNRTKPSQANVRAMAQILKVSVSDISDLKAFSLGLDKPYYFESLTPIEQVQQQIKGTLTTEEKQWVFSLIRQNEQLRDEVAFLKTENRKMFNTVEPLQAYIYSKNKHLKFTYVNAAFCKFLGFSASELLGTTNNHTMGKIESDALDELERRVFFGETIKTEEIIIPGSNNKSVGLFSATPITNEDDHIIGITVSIEDITERAATREHLKLIEKVINKSNEILWIKKHKPVPHIAFTGSAISGLTGFSSEKFYHTKDCWMGLILEEDRKKVKQFYVNRQEGKIEYRITDSRGENKWILEDCYFEREHDVDFGIIRNITERKNTTIELEKLKKATDNSNDFIYVADILDEGKGLYKHDYINGREKDILGLDKNDFKENKDSWYSLIIKKHRKQVLKEIKNKKSKHKELVYQIKRPDTGEERWIRDKVTVENDTIFGRASDITEEYIQAREKEYLLKCLNNIDSMFWIAKEIDVVKNIYKYITLSNGVKKVFGCSKDEFSIKSRDAWISLLHPEHKQMIDIHLEDFKENQFPIRIEYKIIRKKKERRIREEIYKKDGLFFGLTFDITEYNKGELRKPMIQTNVSS